MTELESALLIGFGFGFVVGAWVFDLLWRHINRLEKRLAERRAALAAVKLEGVGEPSYD